MTGEFTVAEIAETEDDARAAAPEVIHTALTAVDKAAVANDTERVA